MDTSCEACEGTCVKHIGETYVDAPCPECSGTGNVEPGHVSPADVYIALDDAQIVRLNAILKGELQR